MNVPKDRHLPVISNTMSIHPGGNSGLTITTAIRLFKHDHFAMGNVQLEEKKKKVPQVQYECGKKQCARAALQCFLKNLDSGLRRIQYHIFLVQKSYIGCNVPLEYIESTNSRRVPLALHHWYHDFKITK
uniref:Uncharacterized protein n=1 Tax=Romanomermis culicivorax TaxID=13658 RepID=A0A915I346_ROMCU